MSRSLFKTALAAVGIMVGARWLANKVPALAPLRGLF